MFLQYWGLAIVCLVIAFLLSLAYAQLTGNDCYIKTTISVARKIIIGFIVAISLTCIIIGFRQV